MLGAVMLSPEALSMLERGVEEARACGHQPSLGLALGIRGALTCVQGQPARALVDIDEADACYAATGDFHARAMMSMVRGIAATFEGRFDDARQAYERSVDQFRVSGDGWAAGVVFQRMAELAERQGRFDDAGAALEEAVARAAQVPNRFAQALLQAQLASTRLGQGRLEEAAALADEALGRGYGNAHAAILPQANHIRGRIAMRQRRFDDAEPDLRLAMDRYRAQDYPALTATCLSDLGRIATARGDGAAAIRLHAEAATLAGQTDDPMVTLSALEGLAVALATAGECARAAGILGLADVLRDAGATPWDPNVDERAAVEAALGDDDEFVELRHQGRLESVDTLVKSLLA
jgi:tetratricopeptide (TPR) repeat protein